LSREAGEELGDRGSDLSFFLVLASLSWQKVLNMSRFGVVPRVATVRTNLLMRWCCNIVSAGLFDGKWVV